MMRNSLPNFVLSLILIPLPTVVSSAATLYVSTGGPLPTLAAARDKIRELRRAGAKGAMTVLVRGGTYFLEEPFDLTPEDSGTKDQPVTYAAYPGERAVLSGGRRITGWTKKDNRMWTAPASFGFRQMFAGGMRALRARTPNQGFYRVDGRITQEKPMVFKFRGDDIKKAWAERGDVEVTVLCSWQESRGRITAVDEAAHTVQVATVTPRPAGLSQRDCYYWIENAPDALDNPTEWYLDQKAGVVNYWPRGEDPSQEEVIAPVLEQLVRIKGEPENGRLVHDVVFRGLDFRHSAWTLPEGGYRGMQAASTVPAAFTAEGAENVSIDHCMFTEMGNYAISFGRGCFRNRVVGNEIVNMGGGGVIIGEPTMNRQRPTEAERSGANLVADNHMHQLGRIYSASVGVLVGQSSDNTISHNHIHDLFYTAISVGWTWQYKLVALKNNIIEYNHLHDLGHMVMSDMGGIYTLGEQPGTVLRNNLIHDVNALVYGGWGIYLDQATSNILVENNVVYNCNNAGFNQNFGRENLVRNNVFAYNKEFQWMRNRSEQHLSFTMERNIVYFDEGRLLGKNWSGGLKANRNLYWDARGREIRPAGKSWKEWQAAGMDTDSLVADPLFVNPDNFDFRLKPGSPALKLGFQQIDMSTVGPRGTVGPAANRPSR
jgi:parallel beta-helix repeat protein